LTNACERIDEVPNDKLNDDDKLKLKGLLAELEQAQQKDSNAKKRATPKSIVIYRR
jgi:hypothetical protein